MDKDEFKRIRKTLKKTQKEMAQLLGVSLKAVHSYEQGWRNVPPAVERQMFFLLSRINSTNSTPEPCWEITACSAEQKKRCPAWEFHVGDLCWFINGTICHGGAQQSWQDKMKLCRSCKVFKNMF